MLCGGHSLFYLSTCVSKVISFCSSSFFFFEHSSARRSPRLSIAPLSAVVLFFLFVRFVFVCSLTLLCYGLFFFICFVSLLSYCFFFLLPLSWWTRCQKRRTMWARRTENHVTINPDELCSRNYQTTQFNNKTQTSVVLTTTTISLACTSMSVRVYSYTAFKGDPACRSKMLFAVRLRGTLASSNWPVLRSESEITKELWRFSVFEKEKR